LQIAKLRIYFGKQETPQKIIFWKKYNFFHPKKITHIPHHTELASQYHSNSQLYANAARVYYFFGSFPVYTPKNEV
jgi:hypothetical protein